LPKPRQVCYPVFRNPQPMSSRDSSYVARKEYAPEWEPERFIVPLLASEIARLIDTVGDPSSENSVLDVGCGRQPWKPKLLEAGFQNYASVDVNQNPEGTVTFLAAIDQNLPHALIESGPYDLLFCTEVLEHVLDWSAAFSNFAQLTRKGAKVIITCPHIYPLHEAPYDYWRPTPFALKEHASRHGFEAIELKQAGTGWDVLGTVLAEAWVYPTSRTLHARIRSAILRKLIRMLYRMIRSGSASRHAELRLPLYLSNVALLERHD